MNTELIEIIRGRAIALRREALKVEVEEGDHRSSTQDDYFRGAADALVELAKQLESGKLSKHSEMLRR